MKITKSHKAAFSAALASLALLSGGRGLAQGVDGDLFDGVTVTANSPTLFGIDDPNEAFSGPNGTGPIEPGSLLFPDTPGLTSFLEFNTSAPVFINGVNLITQSDNATENGDRNTAGFRLFANLDANPDFEVALVPTTNPIDNGAGNIYTFGGVTAQFFRAEFVNGNGTQNQGARIVEFDAVPEPATIGLLGLGALSLLTSRRRQA